MKALVIITVVIVAALAYRLFSSLRQRKGSAATSKVSIESSKSTLERALRRYKDLDD